MQVNIEQTLRRGIEAQEEGKLKDAERFYRLVLKAEPLHSDANYCLGVLAVSANKADESLPLFKKAIKANSKKSRYWFSYIDALIKGEKFEAAEQVIEQVKKKGMAAEKLTVFETRLALTDCANQSKSTLQRTKLTFSEKRKKLADDRKKKKVNRQSGNAKNPSETETSDLLKLYKNQKYDEAEKLARSLTEKFPAHDFAWKVLGGVYKKTDRVAESLIPMQKAVQCAPQDADAYYSLGVTLEALEEFEEAGVNYKQAISLKPHYPEAFNNLGITLYRLGVVGQAEASYRQAITLKPRYSQAHKNLGNLLQDLGRVEEALVSYKRAIELRPDDFEAMINQANAASYTNDLVSEIALLEKIVRINPRDYSLRASVNLAICAFLEVNFASSKKHLFAAAKIQEKKSFEFKNEKIYQRYLLRILEWHQKNPRFGVTPQTDKCLYVIGESHSLVCHNLPVEHLSETFFCKAKLIKGCKQWHLGNSLTNKFKYQFENIICALPKSSEILMMVGEIDCRLDTGILQHKKKFPRKEIKKIILDTIINYLTYVEMSNLLFCHNITIQGVPCPNIDTSRHEEKDVIALIEVINIFNYELKAKSQEKGFKFLDVHKLTDDGYGLSNRIWHSDDYHLTPDGFLEAWNKYLF